jgi:hypothetical protein
MPQKHTIDSMSVWLDKPAIQQAFTTLAAAIIEAKVAEQRYGKETAAQLYGDDGLFPMSGEAIIGRTSSLVFKLSIEPEKGGYMGEHLEHEEINAIGISDMVVDGQRLSKKEQ